MKKTISLLLANLLFVAAYGQSTLPAVSLKDIIGKHTLENHAKSIELNYTVPNEYTASPEAVGFSYTENPKELLRSIIFANTVTSEWTHQDGECVLFITCSGDGNTSRLIDKDVSQIDRSTFSLIGHNLKIVDTFKYPTTDEMEQINKAITYWPEKKAKKTFNAQHVITYPLNEAKAVYKGKYTLVENWFILKWGHRLSVSFLVTDNGLKNLDKYKKDIEKSFKFND